MTARQVAVVTGAVGGIGRAVAESLVAEGAGVIVSDVDSAACEKEAVRLNEAGLPGRAVACRLDVTDPAQWATATRLARRRFGYPTLLGNRAEVSGVSHIGSAR